MRDLAEVLAASIEAGHGPRRLLVGGTFVTWAELGALTDHLCGRRARRVRLPRPVLLAAGTALDGLRRVLPIAYPLTRDGAEIMATMTPTNDAPTLEALGVTLRPLPESPADALRGMVQAGHLPASSAPRLEAEHP